MNHPMNAQQQLLSTARMRGWEPLVWLLAFALPLLVPGHALIVNEVAIVALFAVSLDLVLGYTGIVSLGHAAFLGLGAYASALFAKHVMPDPLVGLIFGMPSVTMSRVRSVPRKMVSEHSAPSSVAQAMPNSRPTSGSGITCLANKAEA